MTESEMALKIATLEGKVDALCLLFAPKPIAVPGVAAPNGVAEPIVPQEIHEAVKAMSKGNRQLTRHLYSVALELLADELEPAVIVRRIRDGERAD